MRTSVVSCCDRPTLAGGAAEYIYPSLVACRSEIGVAKVPVRPVLSQGVVEKAYLAHAQTRACACVHQPVSAMFFLLRSVALQVSLGNGIERWPPSPGCSGLIRTKVRARLRNP